MYGKDQCMFVQISLSKILCIIMIHYELFIHYFHQVRGAWAFNRTRHHWVDFGNNTGACMALPETCGAAGGAISLWINVIDFYGFRGIVSSVADDKMGSVIFHSSSDIRYVVDATLLKIMIFRTLM